MGDDRLEPSIVADLIMFGSFKS